MGCGNEISDWDDKAVKDSLAGKNTGLSPEILKEAEERREARDFFEKITSGFEKSGIVDNRDMIYAISHVPLAREFARELERVKRIQSITFTEDPKIKGESTVEPGKGIRISIGPATNIDKEECLHTLYHEIGELYFLYVLPTEQGVEWERMRAEAKVEYLNVVEKDETTKELEDIRAQHHFAERFAEYCMATFTRDSGRMDKLCQRFPEQMKALDKLIGK